MDQSVKKGRGTANPFKGLPISKEATPQPTLNNS